MSVCVLMLTSGASETERWISLDQLSGVDLNQTITEVRFADLDATADKANLKASDLLPPGDGEDSFSIKLANLLIEKGYQGPIAVATNVASYTDGNRHRTVEKLSFRLAQLAAGEDPTASANPEEAAAEEATEDAEGAEAKTEEADATTAKADDAAPAASAT